MVMPTYLVPKDSAALVSKAFAQCMNMRLILACYIPDQVIQKQSVDNRTNWRDQWLKNVCKQIQPNKPPLTTLIAGSYERWQARMKAMNATAFTAQAQGRLIMGLGGKGPLETGITLQHVTGLPVIPGSALKGLTRTYALLIIGAKLGVKVLSGDEWQKHQKLKNPSPTPLEALDELLVMSDSQRQKHTASYVGQLSQIPEADIYRAAFGSQENAGWCVFHEAVIAKSAASGLLFEVDVMTPHFREYYENEGGKPPHDADSPNPILFLTVAAGTTFAFSVGLRNSVQNQAGSDTVLSQVVNWLRSGLSELGIGSKTAAGYGVFEPNKPIANGST